MVVYLNVSKIVKLAQLYPLEPFMIGGNPLKHVESYSQQRVRMFVTRLCINLNE